MIYFVHIPKTAGTSLQRLFAHGAISKSICFVYPPPEGVGLDELCKSPERHIQGKDVVYGHFPFGIDRRIGRPGIYLTCLREAEGRLVSTYFQHVRGGFVGEMTLLEYFWAWKPRDMDNYAVRLLSGAGHDVEFGSVTRIHLEKACENLMDGVAAFGLYEYLPQTIDKFCRATNLTPVEIGRENASPPSQTASSIAASDIAAVVRHNALDEEFYAFAKEKFLRSAI